MARDLTLKALAEAVAPERGCGVAAMKVSLCRWAKSHGLPCDRPTGGEPLFDLAEVREWLARHKPAKKPPALQIPAVSAPEPLPQDADEARLLAILNSPSATPLEIADAGFRLSARDLSRAYSTRNMAARHLEGFAKQSDAVRKAKDAHLDQAEREGRLIDRDVVLAMLGEALHRLHGCFAQLKNELPAQVQVWIEDKDFLALANEGRARVIYEWAERRASEIRAIDAAELERQLDAERRESEAA